MGTVTNMIRVNMGIIIIPIQSLLVVRASRTRVPAPHAGRATLSMHYMNISHMGMSPTHARGLKEIREIIGRLRSTKSGEENGDYDV